MEPAAEAMPCEASAQAASSLEERGSASGAAPLLLPLEEPNASTEALPSPSSAQSGGSASSSEGEDDEEESGSGSDDDVPLASKANPALLAGDAGGAIAGRRRRKKREVSSSAGSDSGSDPGDGSGGRRKRQTLFKRVRSTERCGKCRTCLNPQLKKACETIRAQQTTKPRKARSKPDMQEAALSTAPARTPTPPMASSAGNSASTILAMRDTLARILSPHGQGGVTDVKHVPALESLLAEQTELGPRSVLLAVITMSSDEIRAMVVSGKAIKVLETWVVEAAEGRDSCRDPAARAKFLCDVMHCLSILPVDVEALRRTGIGRTFGKLPKTMSKDALAGHAADVVAACKALVDQWKRLVEPTAGGEGAAQKTAADNNGGGHKRRDGGAAEQQAVKKPRPAHPADTSLGVAPPNGTASASEQPSLYLVPLELTLDTEDMQPGTAMDSEPAQFVPLFVPPAGDTQPSPVQATSDIKVEAAEPPPQVQQAGTAMDAEQPESTSAGIEPAAGGGLVGFKDELQDPSVSAVVSDDVAPSDEHGSSLSAPQAAEPVQDTAATEAASAPTTHSDSAQSDAAPSPPPDSQPSPTTQTAEQPTPLPGDTTQPAAPAATLTATPSTGTAPEPETALPGLLPADASTSGVKAGPPAGTPAAKLGIGRTGAGRTGGLQLSLGRLSAGAGLGGESSTRLGTLRNGAAVTRLGSLRDRQPLTAGLAGVAGGITAAAQIAASEQQAAALFGAAAAAANDAAIVGTPVVALPGPRAPAAERAAAASANGESAMAGDPEMQRVVSGTAKRKRVHWPEDDAQLQAVRWFRKDDPPSKASQDAPIRPPAPSSLLAGTGLLLGQHAPGFERAARREHARERAALAAQHDQEEREQGAMLERLKAMRPTLPYITPPLLWIDPEWRVSSGEESTERHLMAIKAQTRPPVSYPTQQHVPPTPAEAPATFEQQPHMSLIPRIPLQSATAAAAAAAAAQAAAGPAGALLPPSAGIPLAAGAVLPAGITAGGGYTQGAAAPVVGAAQALPLPPAADLGALAMLLQQSSSQQQAGAAGAPGPASHSQTAQPIMLLAPSVQAGIGGAAPVAGQGPATDAQQANMLSLLSAYLKNTQAASAAGTQPQQAAAPPLQQQQPAPATTVSTGAPPSDSALSSLLSSLAAQLPQTITTGANGGAQQQQGHPGAGVPHAAGRLGVPPGQPSHPMHNPLLPPNLMQQHPQQLQQHPHHPPLLPQQGAGQRGPPNQGMQPPSLMHGGHQGQQRLFPGPGPGRPPYQGQTGQPPPGGPPQGPYPLHAPPHGEGAADGRPRASGWDKPPQARAQGPGLGPPPSGPPPRPGQPPTGPPTGPQPPSGPSQPPPHMDGAGPGQGRPGGFSTAPPGHQGGALLPQGSGGFRPGGPPAGPPPYHGPPGAAGGPGRGGWGGRGPGEGMGGGEGGGRGGWGGRGPGEGGGGRGGRGPGDAGGRGGRGFGEGGGRGGRGEGGGRGPRVCAFFNSAQGCRKGSTCDFLHVARSASGEVDDEQNPAHGTARGGGGFKAGP